MEEADSDDERMAAEMTKKLKKEISQIKTSKGGDGEGEEQEGDEEEDEEVSIDFQVFLFFWVDQGLQIYNLFFNKKSLR